MRTRASRDTSPHFATKLRIMQPGQSTSAAAADPHATSIEQRTAEHIRTAVLASEQRLGTCSEQRRQLPSPRFLERCRPTTSHNVEGTSPSPTRRQVFSPPAQRLARPTTRGQHGNGRCAYKAYLPVTNYDDQATPPMIPARYQRHPYPPALHPVSGKRVGRYTQPRSGHRRLAA
jgi:hypothetical protein